MKMKTKPLFRIMTLIMSVMMLFSCISSEKTEENDIAIQINPLSAASNSAVKQVTVYYKYSYTDMLIGYSRALAIPVNERIEFTVLNDLIKGRILNRSEYVQLINNNTEIISITDSGDTLNITLSKEFLDFENDEGDLNVNKRLAIYSIVNTMIEVSGYSRVQILIDKDDSGKGERMTLSEAGFESEGFLEPLGYNADIILTPENTVKTIFDAMTRKDFEELYYHIAYYDENNTEKIDESVFVSRMYEQLPSFEAYTLHNCIVSNDGQTAYVLADFNLRFSGEIMEYINIPVKIVKENDIWKIQFSRFEALFLGL